MIDSDDFDVDGKEEPVEESCHVNESLLYNKLPHDLPFDVNVRWEMLEQKESRFYLGSNIVKLAKKYNASPDDVKIAHFLRGRVIELLELDYAIRNCMKNNYSDSEVIDALLKDYESKTFTLQRCLNKMKFVNEMSDEDFDKTQLAVEMFEVSGEKYNNFFKNTDNTQEETLSEPQAEDDDNEMNRVEQNDADYYHNEESYDDELPDTAGEFDDDFNNMDDMYESINTKRINEEGTKLNVFGKHPGYRKKPMSLPQTGSDKVGELKDWNDDSVYSEQPFGEKIGSSAPFDKIIEESINAVLAQYKKKL
jgi:hypothetical protein